MEKNKPTMIKYQIVTYWIQTVDNDYCLTTKQYTKPNRLILNTFLLYTNLINEETNHQY